MCVGLLAPLPWVSSWIFGTMFPGQVWERCDDALHARYNREVGDLNREYEFGELSWRWSTKWRCEFVFVEEDDVVAVSVRIW